MLLRVNGQPHRLYTRDPAALHTTSAARMSCRLPAGHPEGFLEAFANIYTAVYEDLIGSALGRKWDVSRSLYPTVVDGVEGMNFVAQCVASSRGNGAWMPLLLPSSKEVRNTKAK